MVPFLGALHRMKRPEGQICAGWLTNEGHSCTVGSSQANDTQGAGVATRQMLQKSRMGVPILEEQMHRHLCDRSLGHYTLPKHTLCHA
jgi:hypothetical protein